MKQKNVKKYSKIVMALIAAGVISGGISYWSSTVKLEDQRKTAVWNSVHEGKFLAQKIGKDVLMLGDDYLNKETLQDAQFRDLMETKDKFDAWLASIFAEPEFGNEATVIKEAWKDFSDQVNFLRNYYNSSVKTLSNPVEEMMVTRKNRGFLISANRDNLPNDIPYGAENTIENQRVEYSSSLKQNLRNQVEKTLSSYKTNSDAINKALNTVLSASDKGHAERKAAAMQAYMIIGATGFILIFLSIMLLGGSDKSKESKAIEEDLSLIMNNIKEGMFIMNPNWEIIGNISASLGDLIGKELMVGDNFYTFLQSKVDNKTSVLAKDYLKLLIEKNLNEKLVSNVNPLKLVNIGTPNDEKMIAVSLSPIKGSGEVSKVLVTILDANEQKKLEDNVKTEKTKASSQFDFLLKIMQSEDHKLFIQFFQKLQETICEQNDKLKAAKSDEQSLRELLVEMQGQVHTLKAQAGVLDLGMYQSILHDFEKTLLEVKRKSPLKAEDMHALSFFHKDFLEKTESLIQALDIAIQNRSKGQMAETAALAAGASIGMGLPTLPVETETKPVETDTIDFHPGISNLNTGGLSLLGDDMKAELGDLGMLDQYSAVKHSESLLADLTVLAKNATEKLGKKVNISMNLSSYDLLNDEKRDSIRSILMHLVNNSIAHGIETVEEREKKNKYPFGVIQIFDEVVMDNFQEVVHISVVDDGAGLNLDKIKAKALKLGMDIGDGSPGKLIPLIFKEDFSTNDEEDLFSGRGIGLNYVKSEVEKLGGSINLKMRPGNYIEFRFKFNMNDF